MEAEGYNSRQRRQWVENLTISATAQECSGIREDFDAGEEGERKQLCWIGWMGNSTQLLPTSNAAHEKGPPFGEPFSVKDFW